MKKVVSFVFLSIFVLGLFVSVSSVEAKTIKIKGYYKPSTMKYVMPSYRTSPNKTKFDNYSTKGNFNPYTGKKGAVNPFKYKW